MEEYFGIKTWLDEQGIDYEIGNDRDKNQYLSKEYLLIKYYDEYHDDYEEVYIYQTNQAGVYFINGDYSNIMSEQDLKEFILELQSRYE